MASQDLTAPLGVAQVQKRRKTWSIEQIIKIFNIACLVIFAGLGIYIAIVDDPMGGQPFALVAIDKQPVLKPVEAIDNKSKTNVLSNRYSGEATEASSGVSVLSPEGQAPSALIIRIPDTPNDLKAGENQASKEVSQADLLERTRQGLLPRIASNGTRPSDAYAKAPAPLSAGIRLTGRIALVVSGLGISKNGTVDAIAKLPAPVTLAFAPYGTDLERSVSRARSNGHEIMLQIPMEPFDYPDNDPGPHTLTVAAKPSENLDRLQWVMSRFTGYVGIMNFMGAKITADPAALTPVMKEINSRGLVFLDDGSSSRSLAVTVGQNTQTPSVRADIPIDAVPKGDVIDKELTRLEALARERGLAIGTANALPVSVERIAVWAKTLEAKGIQLVPVSSAYQQGTRP